MTNSLPDDGMIMTMARNFLAVLPHCQMLGMQVHQADQSGVTLKVPYSDQIIGNPETGVIHSGIVTTLLDTTCGISTICGLPQPEICPTLDLRIDHMVKPEPGQPVYATAEPYRVSSEIIFTRGTAWQTSPDEPFAHAVGTFIRLGNLLSLDAMGKRKGEN